jgi:hypothetical protein
MPSTFSPPQVTVSATCTPSSVTFLTVPRTTTSTRSRRRAPRRLGELAAQLHDRAGPPAQVSRARAVSAWVYIPWAMTPGSPTDLATRSDQWIGLKSPLAPA